MRPSVIYLRKSRADIQAEMQGETETLARHEAALVSLAKAKNILIGNIYREVESGDSISERPVVQRLIREVEDERWESVLVMDVDRLARGDTIDQGIIAQTFQYSRTKIVTPVKTYDPNNEFDEEYFEYGLFMARREYKAIKRRMQRGREASVREGKYVGSCAPYGYDRVKIEHGKGYTLKINEEQANAIRLIFELYTKGLPAADGTTERIGVSKIVRYLNHLGIKPKREALWSPASVRDILINPVYIGKVRWNWRPVKWKIENGEKSYERPRNSGESFVLTDGLHEALIAQETWDMAQKYMKSNPPRPIQIRNTVKNPLVGLIVCGKCGRKMVRRPYGDRQPPALICPYSTCNNVSSKLEIVECRVLSSLQSWVREYQLTWNAETANPLAAQIRLKEEALAQLDKKLLLMKQKTENIYNFLEQGIYSTEVFLERSRKLSEETSGIEKQRELIQNVITTEKKAMQSRKYLIPKIEHLLDVYWELDSPKHKNDMLREVIDKIEYTKDKRGTGNSPNDDFVLTLYPRLPEDNA